MAAGGRFDILDIPGQQVEVVLRHKQVGPPQQDPVIVRGKPFRHPQQGGVVFAVIVKGSQRIRPQALDVVGMKHFVCHQLQVAPVVCFRAERPPGSNQVGGVEVFEAPAAPVPQLEKNCIVLVGDGAKDIVDFPDKLARVGQEAVRVVVPLAGNGVSMGHPADLEVKYRVVAHHDRRINQYI
ncbi:hypothetical protein ES703_43247 [subsurface metagenome]